MWFQARPKLLDFIMRSMRWHILGSVFKTSNQRILEKHQHKPSLRLHLGCGSKILNDWINIDAIWRPNVVVLPLPEGLKSFENNSVEYIYTCHFLEHLQYPKKVIALLETCYSLLKPGGVMRIGVPDIEIIIRAYARNDTDFFKIQSELYHPPWCTTKLEHLMYALQQDGEHKYAYDFETLHKTLTQAGFEKAIKSGFRQSTFQALKIDYREDNNLTLFVDAIKAKSSVFKHYK